LRLFVCVGGGGGDGERALGDVAAS
jgi:hypothetical protein